MNLNLNKDEISLILDALNYYRSVQNDNGAKQIAELTEKIFEKK